MDNKLKGQKDYVEAMCAQMWKELYRFIYYKVQNREEAQDITQETFVRTISFFERNREQVKNHSGYLKMVALNIIRDQWRKKKRRGNDINIDEVSEDRLYDGDFTDGVNERSIIEEAMKELTPEQQEVIRLRIMEGYTAAETANIMGRKEGTIRVIQYRAIKKLSQLLGDSTEEVEG